MALDASLQTELALFRLTMDKSSCSAISSAMLKVLVENGGWLTRRQLAEYGFDDRACRLAGEFSDGRIIFGQRGYRASECATVDELNMAASTLMSQARAMTARACAIQRFLHRNRTKG